MPIVKGQSQPIAPADFDFTKRAFPFTDGEVLPGVLVHGDCVTFKGQMGPVGEVGVNGCQIDAMIAFARRTIEVFDQKVTSVENKCVLQALAEAEFWLKKRTEDRRKRQVEGTSKI